MGFRLQKLNVDRALITPYSLRAKGFRLDGSGIPLRGNTLSGHVYETNLRCFGRVYGGSHLLSSLSA